jgi:hypothetical protein
MREMLDGSLGGDIHVEMNFGADLWPVEVDTGEAELAVVNLCVNARDACRVEASRFPSRTCAKWTARIVAKTARPLVADTGAECAEVKARVRAVRPTKDVEGSGLGPRRSTASRSTGRRVWARGAGRVTVLLPVRFASRPGRCRRYVCPGGPVRNDAVLLVEDDREVAA